MLHEMADGRPFRDARDHNHMYSLVMGGDIAPLRLGELPRELEELRVGLLHPDPEKRVGSAERALEMLYAWPGYAGASLELAKLVRKRVGVDAPRSGIHAAASVSGEPIALRGDDEDTRTARVSVEASSIASASSVETQTQALRPADASDTKQRGRAPLFLGLATVFTASMMGWALLGFPGMDSSKPPASSPAAETLAVDVEASPGSAQAPETLEAPGSEEQARLQPLASNTAAVEEDEIAIEHKVAEPPNELRVEPSTEPSTESSTEPSTEPSVAVAEVQTSDPEAKPVPLKKARVNFYAGNFKYTYVKIGGRTHLLEPLKQGVRLRPGRHRLLVSKGKDGPYSLLGTVEVKAGRSYEVRLSKSPRELVTQEVH